MDYDTTLLTLEGGFLELRRYDALSTSSEGYGLAGSYEPRALCTAAGRTNHRRTGSPARIRFTIGKQNTSGGLGMGCSLGGAGQPGETVTSQHQCGTVKSTFLSLL
jgi:hypothetical protein